MELILKELMTRCQQNSNASNANYMKAYMKEKFDFLGIKSPLRKEIFREIKSEIKSKSFEKTWSLIEALWQLPEREYQYLAMDISSLIQSKIAHHHLGNIKQLIVTKSWWDTVDFLASNTLGKCLSDHPNQVDIANEWINSQNMWIRRSALLFQLKYKDKTDFNLLSRLILSTAHEEEFFIRKACGWALRQYSKFDPKAVQLFIDENKSKLSRLTIREGSKYLT